MGSTVNDHILTDNVTIANDALRLLSTELEVLWQSADDSTLVHLIILTHARTSTDADEGEDNAAVANLHVVFDVGEREYLYVVADFRLWRYLSFWTYFACHNFKR